MAIIQVDLVYKKDQISLKIWFIESNAIYGSESDKIKLDSKKKLSSEVLNPNSVVKPTYELSNMSSEARLGFSNGKGKELGNKSIKEMETRMIYSSLIGPLCIFFYFSISLEMVNAII